VSGRLGVLAGVARNPTLRRVEAAFLAFSIGEWATWIAVVIYAYGRGGATEAGIIAFVQLVPSVIVAPAFGSLGDRYPRARVLVATYVLQGAAMAAVAVALGAGWSPLLVYLLATMTATAVTLTRPVQTAFLPQVVDTPDELTAANVASGTIEGAGTLLGPAFAGVLVAFGGPALVFAASAAGLVVAALTILPVARVANPRVEREAGELDRGLRHELLAGVAAIRADARLRGLAAMLACSMFLLGSLDIFYGVLAFDLLGLAEQGVGFLGAATGVGMLLGATIAVSLVGRAGLGGPLVAAALLFGGAIALLGAAPGAVLSAVLLAIAGVGSQFVYIGTQTMTQRVTSDVVLSRVFGVFEALMMAATALGALAVPVLIAIVGEQGAFVVAGLSLPVVALLAGRALILADRTAVLRPAQVGLLRNIPLFAPLSAPVLEALAAGMVAEDAAAGTTIIRQGDAGDRYFVIANGSVAVDIDGRQVNVQGPGEGFGEIALLRDVPRTATVRAIDGVSLYSLRRELFLAALTGVPASRAAAERIVRERLAASR
jgi:MFS family permease